MLTGPLPATHRVLARAGMQCSDIDLFEVNEAFATVVQAWQREFQADPARVNPHGGRRRPRSSARRQRRAPD